jgi:hypothetical protein
MNPREYIFERRGREGHAEDAEKKTKFWLFLSCVFCVFCEVFAPSAFKKNFSLSAKGTS